MRGLFSQSRRDFSHGCVRVEDPVALAVWVLRDNPGWTPERIRARMRASDTLRVDVLKPTPIWILYGTAIVLEDEQVRFYQDFYGHDAVLEAALAKRNLENANFEVSSMAWTSLPESLERAFPALHRGNPWQTPIAVGVPKTGFPSEVMASVAAHNIAAQIEGKPPAKEKAFGDIPAVCVMDAGNMAVMIFSEKMLPPRKHELLISRRRPTGPSWLLRSITCGR